jgi:hypothetical protein
VRLSLNLYLYFIATIIRQKVICLAYQ